VTLKTRRRVFLAVLVLALTVRAESLFLQSLTTTNSAQAVRQWASGLDAASLNSAAAQIQSYPFAYRKAIMTALSPVQRAAVWQNHVRTYAKAHPELDANTAALLETTARAITPEALSDPNDQIRASFSALGDAIKTSLGTDTALYLLYRLGPQDGTFTPIEPTSVKISNFIRDKFTVLARTDDCNCEQSYGCYDAAGSCTGNLTCNVVGPWPACGFLWDDNCDGECN
jgi:hypothetical protein